MTKSQNDKMRNRIKMSNKNEFKVEEKREI
jgi:hypothetical protein